MNSNVVFLSIALLNLLAAISTAVEPYDLAFSTYIGGSAGEGIRDPTYLGGSDYDSIEASIRVDDHGYVYVGCQTRSTDIPTWAQCIVYWRPAVGEVGRSGDRPKTVG
jgi:hypothetical protein